MTLKTNQFILLSPERSGLSWRSRLTPPEQDELAVVTVHCDDIPPLPAEALDLLSTPELARAAMFHHALDRHRFQVRHWLLRLLLADWLECDPGTVVIETAADGKPGLAGDLGAASIQFSLSCSHGLAAYAFARGRRVGIDLEKVNTQVECLALANRFFTKNEALTICSATQTRQITLFFQCWTRKEAYLKAAGIRPLDSFEVGIDTKIPVDYGHPEENQCWQISSFPLSPGYQSALVYEKQPPILQSLIHYHIQASGFDQLWPIIPTILKDNC